MHKRMAQDFLKRILLKLFPPFQFVSVYASVYALSRFQTERSSESTVVSFQCL